MFFPDGLVYTLWMTTLPRPYAALSTKHLCEQSHSHQKRTQKRKLTIFGNTKQVIQDYDTVFDNSILLRQNDPLRITYFRIPGMPDLHFVPWHRGSGCLGATAPVTGAAADEYNLNVVDCNASVTVGAGLPSQSVGVWGVPPACAQA